MVLPVMRALRERYPDWQLDLLALTTAAHEARQQGFDCLGYRDFAHWYDPARLEQLAIPLLNDTAHPLVEPAETRVYMGINMHELVDKWGEKGAAERYAAQGRWAFMPVQFMRRVLQHLKPQVVVTTNSPRSEQAVIEAARLAAIPSVCMVDLFSPAGDPFLTRAHYADVLTTISPLGKRNLVIGGLEAERIHVTGSPAFDSLVDARRLADAASDRNSLGWRNHRVILWAGVMETLGPDREPASDMTWFPRQVERILRDSVRAHPDQALVIRYHPNQTRHFSVGPPQDRIFWSNPLERHPHRDVLLADLVVVNGSTIGLEAAIAGKSVLAMDNSPGRHMSPLSDFGVARGIPDFDSLTQAVLAALDKPFVSEFEGLPGGAAGRVADLVAQFSSYG